MASALKIAWVAGRLRVFASGEIDLTDERTLARVTELLAEYSPEERAQIAARAVEFGADAALVQSLLNLVGGEVIEVTSKPPGRPRFAWWWLAAGSALAILVGAGAGLRARSRRLSSRRAPPLLTGSWADDEGYHTSRAERDRIALLRRLAPNSTWRRLDATTMQATMPVATAHTERRRLETLGFKVDYARIDASRAALTVFVGG